MPAVLVLTTVPDKKCAAHLSRKLVEAGAAACVSVVGKISSTYRWKKKIETAGEYLLFIKTSRAGYKRLERLIVSLHPYESPEILAVPVVKGAEKYLKWLNESVK